MGHHIKDTMKDTGGL